MSRNSSASDASNAGPAARSEQFMATGKDAIAMGVKFAVEFVELDG